MHVTGGFLLEHQLYGTWYLDTTQRWNVAVHNMPFEVEAELTAFDDCVFQTSI